MNWGRMSTDQVDDHARRRGVLPEQVQHDQLVSHLLHALRGVPGFVFFGGTALCRTYLLDGRLSEDIDLIASIRPSHLRADIDDAVVSLRRNGALDAVEPWTRVGSTWVRWVRAEGTAVQVQCVAGPPCDDCPTVHAPVALRYAGLPSHVDLPFRRGELQSS